MAKRKHTLGKISSDKTIRLSKSCLKDGEKQAVLEVLDKEFLGMGKEVQTFEKKLSDFFGRKAICVVNGTSALHLALQACEIGMDDEVLVPSITYVASFQAISATGAKPVACEIDMENLCLDWRDAQKKITTKTKAIMPVHYSGGVGYLEKIYELAQENHLRVIEDAAHAFGTTYKGKKVGSFGDIACFSFDGIKNITSGEGGCIVTDDISVTELVSDARLLGVNKDTEKRYRGERSWDFDVLKQGWRYHMSNIMASIGIVQLKRFDEISEKRKLLAKLYFDELKENKNIRLINHNYDEVVPHIFPIILNSGVNRDKLVEYLKFQNIESGIHYKPNHLLTLYNNKNVSNLGISENIYDCLITLPLHEDLTEYDVRKVVTFVVDHCNNN